MKDKILCLTCYYKPQFKNKAYSNLITKASNLVFEGNCEFLNSLLYLDKGNNKIFDPYTGKIITECSSYKNNEIVINTEIIEPLTLKDLFEPL